MLCVDCRTAESQIWPLYNLRLWCCRARHIWDAAVSCVQDGITLEQARRQLSRVERQVNPESWPLVRERLAEFAARQAVKSAAQGVGETGAGESTSGVSAAAENRGRITA